MASILDPAKERDVHIEQRLRTDTIIWLITVRPDGRPHAVAVWFLWDGDSFLIFSLPNNQKVRNIRSNTNALLALDDTYKGADPITVEGVATLLTLDEVAGTIPTYTEKYREGIKELGFTPELMLEKFSQAIRIKATRVL